MGDAGFFAILYSGRLWSLNLGQEENQLSKMWVLSERITEFLLERSPLLKALLLLVACFFFLIIPASSENLIPFDRGSVL